MAKGKVKFRGNTDNIVVLSIDDLDDLVYSASRRGANKAVNDLYRGLSKAYFNRWDEDIETMFKEIAQIRLRLDSKGDSENDPASTADE